MTDAVSPVAKPWLYIGGALVALYLIAGVLDLKHQVYTGYTTDGMHNVIRVSGGSPAAQAGMQVGDALKSVGGIAVTDTKATTRQTRTAIGETKDYVIDRGGQTLTLPVKYAALPGRDYALGVVSILIGLCFLGFGLGSFLSIPRRSTLLLALVGLCFPIAFGGGPYFESYAVRTYLGALTGVLIFLGFGVLLHFVLRFPEPKPVLAKPSGLALVYGPAIAVTLWILYLTLAEPDATVGVGRFNGIIIGLFVAGYFLSVVVVLLRNYLRASPAQREAAGLSLMFWGAVIGFGPIIVASVVGVVAPAVVLRGSDFYFLTIALIPISFALAALKKEGAAAR